MQKYNKMNIGNNKIYLLIFGLFASTMALFTSCDKADDQFYDYKKEITFNGSIYEYLTKYPGLYDSLVLVLEYHPELKKQLQDPGTQTIFAVQNASFALAEKNLNAVRKDNAKTPIYLEDWDVKLVDTLLQRYVYPETYRTADLIGNIDGLMVHDLYDYRMNIRYNRTNASGLYKYGKSEIIFSDTNGFDLESSWQNTNTIVVDVQTNNGILHVINPSHEFGFGKVTNKLRNR